MKAANELYSTARGISWQCDLTNRVYIQFYDKTTAFKIPEFFAFCKKVGSVNIQEMIYNLSDEYDSEYIVAPQNGLSLNLTLCEIIQLRDLLEGTKFVLRLNSMLHEVLGEAAFA